MICVNISRHYKYTAAQLTDNQFGFRHSKQKCSLAINSVYMNEPNKTVDLYLTDRDLHRTEQKHIINERLRMYGLTHFYAYLILDEYTIEKNSTSKRTQCCSYWRRLPSKRRNCRTHKPKQNQLSTRLSTNQH